jgi:hypothetical protein
MMPASVCRKGGSPEKIQNFYRSANSGKIFLPEEQLTSRLRDTRR